jgi:2-polyprenyl-3-methyl-5-hydroxy-6-metoxy-1,4-benzoquinol methylase
MNEHQREVAQGERFEFGANWARFLSILDEERITLAEDSLKDKLGCPDLIGKRFLDIGSGSGLFSLAAKRLGATVHSFDYDPQSFSCTAELKRRYFEGDPGWTVEQGSVLDVSYLKTLGQWDVVYSWGVLHHTGAQWQALSNVMPLVQKGGALFIALYNDQGWPSILWTKTKRAYCASPKLIKKLIIGLAFCRLWGPTLIKDVLKGQPGASWSNKRRGMSAWHDVIDWVGGYPFQVSKPEEVFNFFRKEGFYLNKLKTCAGGHGCNEYVFIRN